MSDASTEAFDLAVDSLFAGAQGQQELFGAAEALFFAKAPDVDEQEVSRRVKRNPVYTAAFLRKHHPEKWNLIVWMRLQMMPLRYTAAIAEVSTNTVAAVDREIDASAKVDTIRAKLSEDSRSLARMSLERIREILMARGADELDLKDLINVFKHTVEKSELLDGNATQRFEWTPKPRAPNDYLAYIQEAELVPPAQTGPEPEKSVCAVPGPLPSDLAPDDLPTPSQNGDA